MGLLGFISCEQTRSREQASSAVSILFPRKSSTAAMTRSTSPATATRVFKRYYRFFFSLVAVDVPLDDICSS